MQVRINLLLIFYRFGFSMYGSYWNYIDLELDVLFIFDISFKFLTGVNQNGEIAITMFYLIRTLRITSGISLSLSL